MNRKIRPFHDFDRLAPAQLERVQHSLVESTIEKTRLLLRQEFAIEISYGRLRRYYHRWQEALQFKAASGLPIGINEYIDLLNGQTLPYPQLAQHLIQKAACIQAAAPNPTISKLLALQRIASHPFNQEMTREKSALENRKQNLREQQLAQKARLETEKLGRSLNLPQSNICTFPTNLATIQFPDASVLFDTPFHLASSAQNRQCA